MIKGRQYARVLIQNLSSVTFCPSYIHKYSIRITDDLGKRYQMHSWILLISFQPTVFCTCFTVDISGFVGLTDNLRRIGNHRCGLFKGSYGHER